MGLILSCEHAVNKIPQKYMPLFQGHEEVLSSHLGYDLGAAELARILARLSMAPLYLASVSRLVVDCNRSITHPRLFSKFSRILSPLEKETILTRWYLPYRDKIFQSIRNSINRTGRCLHLSVHSFTPNLSGKQRNADLGLLYDPSRSREKQFALAFHKRMRAALPACRVRHNYPYRGVSDGLTTALRRSFEERQYLGFELEINQGLFLPSKHLPECFLQALDAALAKTIADRE